MVFTCTAKVDNLSPRIVNHSGRKSLICPEYIIKDKAQIQKPNNNCQDIIAESRNDHFDKMKSGKFRNLFHEKGSSFT
jgi:hypothetical protein